MAQPQPAKRAKLVGYNNFVRHNPMSDRFNVIAFHHLELLCGDAKTTANFLWCAIIPSNDPFEIVVVFPLA